MNHQLPSLTTSDAPAGLKLAGELAEKVHTQLQAGSEQVARPGGMNYLQPAPVPKEMIASILFYAIAAANRGWLQQS